MDEGIDQSYNETIIKAALRANIEPDLDRMNSKGSYRSSIQDVSVYCTRHTRKELDDVNDKAGENGTVTNVTVDNHQRNTVQKSIDLALDSHQ